MAAKALISDRRSASVTTGRRAGRPATTRAPAAAAPRTGRARKAERERRRAARAPTADGSGRAGPGRHRLPVTPRRSRTTRGWPGRRRRAGTRRTPSATSGVARLGERGDRVLGDHVHVVGDLDALDVVAGGQDVGAVDDAGVEVAGRDLGEQAAHVGLVGVLGGGDARRWPATSRPNSPHGTSAAHRPMSRSASAKSSSPSTSPGLPAGTTISRALRAKTSGSPSAAPASTTWSMFDVFAEANTSPGAPARICSRRADEAARFSSTVTSGVGRPRSRRPPRRTRRSARRPRTR